MPDLEPGVRRRRRSAAGLAVVLFVALVVAPLVTVAVASTFLFVPGGRALDVDVEATGGTYAQLFWGSGYALSQEDSALAPLRHPGGVETLRFPLPSRGLEILRFDPMETGGEMVIHQMRVVDGTGTTVRTVDPMAMLPLYQIATMQHTPAGVKVITSPNANDSMLVLRASWVAATPRWYSLQFVTPFSLVWIAVAVVTLIGTAFWFILRDLIAGPFTRRDALWFAALFLVVFAAKLLLLRSYPVPVPFWDQWDGEALTLYIPWADHGVTWRQMFTFHNEHRIFFSRLLALSLTIANGQWDPHLQIVVNALLHALVGAILAAMLWLALGRRGLPGIAAVLGLVLAAPFGVENSLGGFQSAFYFLLLFSALSLWLMGTSRAGTPGWWLGCFCAACTPFTVAGGILILVPVGVLILLRAIATRSGWWAFTANVVALAALAVIGYAALPPPIGEHAALKAGTFHYFRIAFTRSLAFPFINYPRAVVFAWLPMTILGLAVLRRKLRATTIEQLSLALSVWVVVQCAAMAYARGAMGAAPASRYLDLVALGTVANVMAFLSAMATTDRPRWRTSLAGALVVWLGVISVGVVRVTDEMLDSAARQRRKWTPEHVKNVRLFEMTDDVNWFVEKKGPQDVPYYSAPMLATWLEHPAIQRILPAAVRRPLDVRARDGAPGTPLAAAPQANGDLQPVFDSYAGGSQTAGRFESQPVTCQRFGHLQFEVASSTSWSGLRLALRDVGSGRETTVRMPWDAGGGWNTVAVPCPTGPFTIVAADDSPTNWLAFRQPAEMAWGSTIAWSVIQQGKLLGLAAGILVVLALVSSGGALRGSAERS